MYLHISRWERLEHGKQRYTATLVKKFRSFITRYVTLADEAYSLPLALLGIQLVPLGELLRCPDYPLSPASKRSGKTLLQRFSRPSAMSLNLRLP